MMNVGGQRRRSKNEQSKMLGSKMNPPTANELVGPPPHCMDRQWALEKFLGKSQIEAKAIFRHHTESFAYMASEGLRYYLPAVLEYLRSEESAYEGDFAHGVMCSLYCQMTLSQPLPADVVSLIREIASICDAHREKFEIDEADELFDKYIRAISATYPMSKYRVMIHGHNFLIEVDGTRQRMGFYTQVFVEARDEADAKARACHVLRQDSKLRERVLNGPNDRPSTTVEEIELVVSFDGCTLPRTGLAYYVEEPT